MAERQPIGKKLRFEVFKRDKFTCQYCGGKAPDVVLQVDHMNPVAAGGATEIMNLVTACRGCNSGKGARLLDDSSVVERQRAQIEDLEERRQQLEMMLEWRNELANFKEDVVQTVADAIASKSTWSVSEHGRGHIRKWLDRFEITEILDAIDISFDQYQEVGEDGKVTQDSWEKAFGKVPGVVRVRKQAEEKPHLRDFFYIRGILRNRVRVDERYVMTLIEIAHDEGMSIDDIKNVARHCRDWSDFRDDLHAFIDRARQVK